MICAIHQLHYLPWLRYFHKIANSDIFVVLDDIQFTKGGWQNRNKIKTKQGIMYLTIPVRFNFGDTLDKILIDNSHRWREKHLNAIITNYSPAKYFKKYFDFFFELYKKNWEKLNDINYEILFFLLDKLSIKTKIVKSSELNINNTATQRLVDICNAVGADTYLSGAYAKDVYLDVDLFEKNNIKIIFQEWKCPVYNQLFQESDFIPDLSIIDLLFNEGEKSLEILTLPLV